jgi:hypothetical protein
MRGMTLGTRRIFDLSPKRQFPTGPPFIRKLTPTHEIALYRISVRETPRTPKTSQAVATSSCRLLHVPEIEGRLALERHLVLNGVCEMSVEERLGLF